MDNTKYTKGKWELTSMTNRIIVGESIADVWGFEAHINNKANEEMKANALLISKAPCMLEMLKKVLDVNEYHKFNGHLINEQIEQLIKEATEI